MDPLSDVLSLLKPQNYVTGALTAGEPWALQFRAHEGLKCYSIVKGSCWIAMDGLEPMELRAGTCVLLPHGRAFVIGDDLRTPSVDAESFLASVEKHNGILSASPGQNFFMLASYFALEGDARFLLDVLPPVVMLSDPLQVESMRWAVERLLRELQNPQPGGALVTQQIAYTMLVEALRMHLDDDSQGSTGWLSALADKRMRAALSAMHTEPANAWTVQKLAYSVGMSRTAFAQTFKKLVGSSPMEYLTTWRMTLAANRIQIRGESVASIAPVLGYQSESAFSAAFKRKWGSSPRAFAQKVQVQAAR